MWKEQKCYKGNKREISEILIIMIALRFSFELTREYDIFIEIWIELMLTL